MSDWLLSLSPFFARANRRLVDSNCGPIVTRLMSGQSISLFYCMHMLSRDNDFAKTKAGKFLDYIRQISTTPRKREVFVTRTKFRQFCHVPSDTMH